VHHRNEGHTAAGIAAMMGVSRASVYKWLTAAPRREGAACRRRETWHLAQADAPYRPQTKRKAEAFNKTPQREWAYIRVYTSNDERLAALAHFLEEYNAHRPHTALGGLAPLARICNNVCGNHS